MFVLLSIMRRSLRIHFSCLLKSINNRLCENVNDRIGQGSLRRTTLWILIYDGKIILELAERLMQFDGFPNFVQESIHHVTTPIFCAHLSFSFMQ